MQDRPNYDELLAAVERFLDDEVVAKGEGAQRFHGRVAANVIRIVRRELEHEEAQLASEWESLDTLLGEAPRPRDRAALRLVLAQRNEELSERIRSGDADGGDFRDAVLAHVRETIRDKLAVTNPGWLE
ncbi:MAG: hypothetical protein IIC91_00780 [Chloroflexi bacterium]|nr:hypothetical protein [Chloroflexota bacterium]